MKCPKCKNDMILRDGRNGKFYGCTTYPECRGTVNYDKSKDESLNSHPSNPTVNGEAWIEKIDSLLKENLSIGAYGFWQHARETLPDAWDRPTSSSGKYHRRANGSVPSTAEHTFDMLYAAYKIARMFGPEKKGNVSDNLYIAIALHDGMKYGPTGKLPHTVKNHDKLIGDWFVDQCDYKKSVPLDLNPDVIQEAIRLHSGRWSTDIKVYIDSPLISTTHLIHTLDMLSTADLLKIPGG
jgi:ssDNA-binding Zn-finger/Zn-ribbon topoisomerase 1